MDKTTTIILASLTMVGALAIDAYLPSFHAIGQEFNVSQTLVQQTLSLFLFSFAFMMLFYGTLSDSFGRRPVILCSLALYTLASLGAAFAPSYGWLLGFRILQGLAAGGGTVISRAVVRDRVSGAQAQRTLAHMMLMFGLAPAIAPVLGGWLQVAHGWRSVFLFLALFGAMMFGLCFRFLPESLPRQSRQPFHPVAIAANYLMVLRHPRFLLLIFAFGVAFGGFGIYIGAAADFIMTVLGLPETAFGWLFIPIISGMMIGSALSSRFAARFTQKMLMRGGYAVMACAALANVAYNLAFQASVPWAVIPLFFYTFGLSVITPVITVLALDLLPENRGLASSMQSFVQTLMFASITGLVAPLVLGSAQKLAFTTLAAMALSAALWNLSRRSRAGAAHSLASRP